VILSLGGILSEVEEAAILLSHEGVDVDIYNMRFVKPLDKDHLGEVLGDYDYALLLEDGANLGGLGESVGSLVRSLNLPLAYSHIGAPDRFLAHAERNELLAECGLDGRGIASAVKALVSAVDPSFFTK